MIIHIPAHDGRGFGTAPKAETEIYKRDGQGRIHATCSLDTIAAAKLLYGDHVYDLRTFGGQDFFQVKDTNPHKNDHTCIKKTKQASWDQGKAHGVKNERKLLHIRALLFRKNLIEARCMHLGFLLTI